MSRKPLFTALGLLILMSGACVAAVVILWWQNRPPSPLETGGVMLRYEIGPWDRDVPVVDGVPVVDVEQLCRTIEMRLADPDLPPVLARPAGPGHVEVLVGGEESIEGNDRIDTIRRRLEARGTLAFQILANRRDHQQIIEAAEAGAGHDVRLGGRLVARWVEVGIASSGAPKEILTNEAITRPAIENGEAKTAPNGDPILEFLVIEDPPATRVTGRYLVRAQRTVDESGNPAVGFQLNAQGGHLFYDLTFGYRMREDGSMRRLAILLDGRIHSGPHVREPIGGGQGQITGRFSAQEADDLATILNAGALPELTLVESSRFEPAGTNSEEPRRTD